MEPQSTAKLWIVWVLVALVIGTAGGYWYGKQAGILKGVAQEKARAEALVREAEKAAAQAVNPFQQTTANPFEKAPTNPFEKVKVNPFE